MSVVLIALLAVPLAGAVAAMALPRRSEGDHEPDLRWFGVGVSGLTLALALVLAASFDYGRAGRMQGEVDVPWIPGLDLRFHLGVDGISLPLVVLTALLTFLCFLYLVRHRPETGRFRALVFTLLVLEVGMIGTFLALDLLLFFVFFEIVLIPMYFVIAVWGGADRRAAAVKFILYTLLGSAVLLLGLLLVWSGTGTLDMVRLAEAHGQGMARGVQIVAFLAIGAGLAVKAPMWPLHTWLPAAHTEAPTVGSVLLAGVLLKMGTYGFARIAIPVLPEGAAAVAPWLGAFAVAGIVYGSLACLAQRDLKRMIAYSSVGHMGFVLLGLATLTPVGINAALFGNIAHGLITGLLFFVAGGVKERYGTAQIARLGGGMLGRLPYLGSLLTFACVASLGLPGLAGFWGEMLALLAAFDPAPGLSRPLFLTFMVIGGVGTVLTAAYFLLMLSRVTHGRPDEPTAAGPPPSRAAESLEPWGEPAEPWDETSDPWHLPGRPGEPAGDHADEPAGERAAERGGGHATVPAGQHADERVGERVGGAADEAAGERPGDRVDERAGEPLVATAESGEQPRVRVPDELTAGAVTTAAATGAPVPQAAELAGVPVEPVAGEAAAHPAHPARLWDVTPYELAAWTPLVVLTIVLGLWPKALLALTDPAVRAFLGAP
ncbi:NADH-quinone oxidoreductase subunit M [Sphaerisporangium sp. TRM90804]|uniref:NADH-quinone oxidoreductase subunit M n=1 Tax=Sphaerisporangium sp. TRM90804 TaxID=3031113 RepID=UPI00244D6832|nr:NADH-quinone oxidoreductase subunit M [Sphaerisporangium sp. TRM90804]MDH2428967.1 NADH-quinone oxidoreductase subunit M [Sphaerisporangium sp. TRM90804]